MARPRGIRRPLAGHRPVTKAAALPGGIQLPSGAQTSSLAPQIAALQQGTGQGQAGAVTMAEPLPRSFSDFIAAFGPGVPLVPAPLNGVRTDTGQPDPRRYAYPVSWNLSRDMQRHTPWSLLIQAADKVDIIRRCIEARKDEQTQQDWDFTLSKRALEAAGANTPAEKSALREKYSDKIRQLVDWWQTPDKTNGYEFETWLSMALEEHFVLDALSIYPRLNYGGELASLEVLDGSTIKPLLDARGNRPPAPAPAFQQWLYGFPRGEYTDLGPSDSWEGDAGSLIYAVRTARTRSPYGLSVVEQALVSADLWMHRQQWMRSEYTEGTLPTSWLSVDQSAGNMTPDQIRAWETSLNDFYGGGISQRHRMRLLPQGVSPIDTMDVSERYKPDYDEFLVKLVISHFNVDPMEIGFAPKGGLGGKGFSDGQQDTKYRQAIKPLNTFLSNIINQISRRYLGMPPELTHQFLGMEQEDEKSADEVAEARTSSGRSTFNEDRDRQGMPRYEGEWADKPFIVTAGGPVWLDDAYEESQKPPEPVPAPLAEHAGLPPGKQPPAPADPQAEGKKPDGGAGNIPADDEDEEDDEEAHAVAEKAVGELVAFGRFLAKRGKLTRPFAFEHVEKAVGTFMNETAAADPERAVALVGDIVKVGPKGYIHGWIKVGTPGTKHGPGHGSISGFVGVLPGPDKPGGHGRMAGELPGSISGKLPELKKPAPKKAGPEVPGQKAVDDLRKAYEGGHSDAQELSGGKSAFKVEKVKLSNGQLAVRKQAQPRDTRAEYLSGRVAGALGIKGATVAQTGDLETVAEFVKGRTSADVMEDIFDKAVPGKVEALAAALDAEVERQTKLKNGREIGMLDWLINNDDRHDLNWIVSPDNKSVVPIDHGEASFKGEKKGNTSAFVHEWVRPKTDSDNNVTSVDPQWTKDELKTIRSSIDAIGSEFSSPEEQGWHQFMLSRLDMLMEAK